MFDVYASTDLSDRWTPVRGVAAGVHLALDADEQPHRLAFRRGDPDLLRRKRTHSKCDGISALDNLVRVYGCIYEYITLCANVK